MSSNNKKYLKLPIKGMHCRSCELLVEDGLRGIGNVDDVQVDYSSGEATVHYHGERPNDKALEKAVVEAGYEVGSEEKKPLFNFHFGNLYDVMVSAGVIFVLYLILRTFGLTTLSFNPEASSAGLALPLVVGLVAGVSTCMALVGGLVLGLSAKFSEKHPQASRLDGFRPHLFFVGGRIIGYALFGGLLGLIGSVFQLSPTINAVLTILVGGLMLFIGLQLTNLSPRLSAMSFSMPISVAKFFGINNRKRREYSHKQAMILGGLTFFLPCGFTQAMQVLAISRGSFIEGALIMGLFALGTAPGLLGVGGISAAVKGSFRDFFFRTVGVAVVALSLFNLNNGYTLLSTNLALAGSSDSAQAAPNDPNVTLENGVQIVKMTEGNNGYSPNKFSIQKGVPVKWVITVEAPYSCASSIILPKLGIRKTLEAGENIIEFTPDETDALPFSCSMGMYTGVFNVYDANGSVSNQGNDSISAPTPARGSGTCGVGGGGCGCGGVRPAQAAQTPLAQAQEAQVSDTGSEQVLKATYTAKDWLQPNSFKVKAGTKVKLEIDVKDNGSGCGYAMMIPGLYDRAVPLHAGTPITMEFTPTATGNYPITCSMSMINFGSITVK